MSRIQRHEYYLNIAREVAERSTCLRSKYGAVLVKNDRIISTGYNGSPQGTLNCCDLGECFRIKNSIPSGTQYEKCRSVHAEANALLNSSPSDRVNSTLYLNGYNISNEDPKIFETRQFMECCEMCKRLIINSQVSMVVIPSNLEDPKFKLIRVESWI